MLHIALALSIFSVSPTEAVAQLQATYKNVGDMTAKFEQVYIDKLRGKKHAEQGSLWMKTDGRVRWSYSQPERKDFIFDGKVAYFYEPENAQVTVFEHFEESPLAHALHYLWGQGDIAKTFEVGPCKGICPQPNPGDAVFQMTPRNALPSVDHIVLCIDGKTQRVRESVVFDPLGNRTEYRFSEVQFGGHINAQKFDFTIPAGVSVLKATGS